PPPPPPRATGGSSLVSSPPPPRRAPPPLDRHRPAALPAPRATGRDRHAVLAGDLQHPRHLCRRPGQHHQVRRRGPEIGLVAPVVREGIGIGLQRARPERLDHGRTARVQLLPRRTVHPNISTRLPLIASGASVHRKVTTFATSAGVISGSQPEPFSMSVSVLPGSTAATSTFRPFTSSASAWVKPFSPHLLAQYAVIPAVPSRPLIDETFTTLPQRRSAIPGTQRRQR